MAKEKLSKEEKFQNIEFDLFEAIAAIDRKDYSYYDNLTPEQQKKFVPFMLLHWISAVKAGKDVQSYYLQSTDYHANKHLFNENVKKHHKLQWLMLCAASPGIGKQFHKWIPHIRDRISKLIDNPKSKEIKDYFKKVYPNSSSQDIDIVTEVFLETHKKKKWLADQYPEMKFDEIELLADIITDDEIEQYKKSCGE